MRNPAYALGPVVSAVSPSAYEAGVRAVLDRIAVGDVYQVNLAHPMRGSFAGSARALFAELATRLAPWYGVYLEADEPGTGRRLALASASPELFLSYDACSRAIETRPMKGTRPADGDPSELRDSAKDRAELCMIIDLMRNDLGRVAAVGSVRVETPRAIERHGVLGGVWQATATVRATLREGLGLADLFRAAFPGGSVTGAPKIAAMRIIDELEWAARGPYCGAAGYVSACGRAAFNIAIRTACIEGEPGPEGLDAIRAGTLTYPAGAGIVADSDPASEWRETLDKAAALHGLGVRTALNAGARA